MSLLDRIFNKGVDATQQSPRVLKRAVAMRVIFFYPGEEGTYVDNAEVTLFDNGIVHLRSRQEETTTDLRNCEILWRFETEAEERTAKVRLLKRRDSEPQGEQPADRSGERADGQPPAPEPQA